MGVPIKTATAIPMAVPMGIKLETAVFVLFAVVLVLFVDKVIAAERVTNSQASNVGNNRFDMNCCSKYADSLILYPRGEAPFSFLLPFFLF